jgi:uncharacterized membrane protein required for colicin V production
MMLMAALPPVLAKTRFNYFDGVVLVWLIIGLFRGRKRGMSQELLPLLQWIGIVVAAGLLYWPFSGLVKQYTLFTVLWSCITAYLLIALGVNLIYLWLKQMFGNKLVEMDPFGRSEFYLGMMSGVVRFGCMMLCLMALMNSHIESAADLAKTAKSQKDNFGSITFPTYGQIQQDVLFNSFVGNLVQNNLKPVLVATVSSGPPKKRESIAQKANKDIDDILAKPSGKN